MKFADMTVEKETGKNNSSEEKPIQTGGLHILALMQKPRAVRTHCIASFLCQFVLGLLFFLTVAASKHSQWRGPGMTCQEQDYA